MKMSHTEARRLIHMALDLELAIDAIEGLRAHLEGCAACRGYAAQAQAAEAHIARQLRRADVLPSGYRVDLERIRRRVLARGRRRHIMSVMSTTARRMAVAAAIVVGAIGLVWLFSLLGPQQPLPLSATGTVPQEQTPAGATGTALENTQPAATQAAPVAEDEITITFASLGFFESSYSPLIKEFESLHPGITVQFVSLEEAQAHGATDVAHRNAPPLQELNNYLDLEPLMEADLSFDAAGFWPRALDGCRVGGRQMGLPIALRVSLVMYDGDLFDAAGLPHPAPGWTWQDFRNAAVALADPAAGGGPRYGYLSGSYPLLLLGPLADSVLARHGEEPARAEMEQALGWFADLAAEGAVHVFSREAPLTEMEEMISGNRAAMWLETTSMLRQRFQSMPAAGVAPYPAAEGTVAPTNRGEAECVLISAGTAHPREAWLWAHFLTNRQAPPWAGGAAPARPAVAEEAGYWNTVPAQAREAVRYGLENAWYGFISLDPLGAVGEALYQAATGDASFEAALALADLAAAAVAPAPAGTPVAVATPRPTAAPVTPAPGSAVIQYYVDTNYHTDLRSVQALANAFNQAHPDIYVELADNRTAWGPADSYGVQQIAERFDCFAWGSPPSEGVAPFLYSLDPLIEADPDGPGLLAEISPYWVSRNYVEGSLYALPAGARPFVIYYNKDHLDSLGLEPPALDWTIEDFWDLAQAAAGRSPSGSRIYGFVPLLHYEFVFHTAGVDRLFDTTVMSPQIRFEDPRVVSIVNRLAGLAEDFVIPPIDEGTVRDMSGNQHVRYQAVDSGRAAMWTFFGGHLAGGYTTPAGRPFQVGVAPLPAGSRPTGTAINMFISRQAQNPAACWKWIKFLTDEPSAFHGIPVRQSVLSSPNLDAYVGAETAAAYRAVMAQFVEPREILTEQIYGLPLFWWWREALGTVFQGVPAAQAMADLQRRSESYVACMRNTGRSTSAEYLECAQQADPDWVESWRDR
jgi:ABC-type glycerol-3-phosphate transport system substrate-binding protein